MSKCFIAALGSSAGGLDALKEFFANVKPTGYISYVVISHLPKSVPTQLDYILSKVTALRVELLTDSTKPFPDRVYVLPGSFRVRIEDGILLLRERKKDEVINTAINEFLFSLAEDQREKAIAIILAGMGSDGADGAKKIHENHGFVFAQDPVSTANSSMPLATIDRDHPNAILPPAIIAQTMHRMLLERHADLIKR